MFHIYVINRQLIRVSDMPYRVIGGRAIALPYKSYDFNVSHLSVEPLVISMLSTRSVVI